MLMFEITKKKGNDNLTAWPLQVKLITVVSSKSQNPMVSDENI